jgi:CBS domain-containing protein
MEIELQEIHDYLSQHVLFDELPPGTRKNIVHAMIVRYLRRGQPFPPDIGEEKDCYIVRSGAIEMRDTDGTLYEKLAEDDVYLEQCQPDSQTTLIGKASEDSLLYLIPCSVISSIRKKSQAFDRHFAENYPQRMKLALSRMQQAGNLSLMESRVGDTLYKPAVCIEASASIADCAQRMSKEKVSSILITGKNKLLGIVTDQDLRKRCLAAGISSAQPVSEIMTHDLISIDSSASLADALLVMTQHQVQHLPVMDGGKSVGNLTAADVIRHLGTNSILIASDIKKAGSIEELSHIGQQLPELQLQMVQSNASASRIGETFSSITDMITRRLLQLAEAKLGTSPVPYVWLAGGSQGRQEQTSHSDQDNALIIDDALQEADKNYFSELSKFVCDGLNACGYVYCPGEAMASNQRWRQPQQIWREYFTDWIEKPDKQALMLSSIFFDLRPVAGDAGLFEQLHADVLAMTKTNGIFTSYMVANALTHRPPLGFFRNFVLIHNEEHDNTLDIKHRGVVPIVDIARVLALASGVSAVNTSQRLQAAHAAGALSAAMCEDLVDALEYISMLRNQHQVALIRNAQPADNFLDPQSLSGLERGHLKDAFMIIKEMQEVLEHRYQAGLIT